MVATAKLMLALGAALLFAWGAVADRYREGKAGRRLRDFLLVIVTAASALGGLNFLQFHYAVPDRAIPHAHIWDSYHYFVGARYFDELDYTHLYTCSIATNPNAWRLQRGGGPTVRNLATNELGRITTRDLHHCRERFSQQRWEAFTSDVDWFRGRIPNWNHVFLDWGFNATPVWILFGQRLLGDTPASADALRWRTAVDLPLIALGFVGIGWAFGWRPLCLLLVFWGTNLPAEYSWTGGSLLRHTWFGLLLGGIALLRREYAFLGGAALGAATALRVFPAAVFAGLALLGLVRLVRRDDPLGLVRSLRTGAGALLAVGVLSAAAAPSTGGFGTWVEFARNSAIDSVPSANNLGLKGVLAHRERDKWAMLKGLPESVARWEQGREEALASRQGWRVAGIAAGTALLAAAALRQRKEDWVAAVLGVGIVPIAFHLASYYHVCIVVFGLLATRRPWIGVALCLLAAFSQIVGGLPMESDEQYVWLSLGWLGFVTLCAASVALPRAAPPPRLGSG